MTNYPAVPVKWREVDSSNVKAVGWDDQRNMYVRFRGTGLYMYRGVSRQRAVACSRAKSVGRYINKIIKPRFEALRVA